ncbi:hypothetical protein B0H14DRAFT_3484068 [Mycena olivaceomarginata]|nr:hypothetical protein B0H14DRAFT_3484068 [Mycena olivaceomarginata]
MNFQSEDPSCEAISRTTVWFLVTKTIGILIAIPLGGEAYQYVGGSSNTVPFVEAPSAVVGTRSLIETRVAAALEKAYSFNELLSVAYLEAQSMAVNNEKGLGPVVAGLSLGSPAVSNTELSYALCFKKTVCFFIHTIVPADVVYGTPVKMQLVKVFSRTILI